MAFAGDLGFDPTRDTIDTPNGGKFKFSAPTGDFLPSKGFDAGEDTYQAPVNINEANNVSVDVDPNSDRIELLNAFEKWDGNDINDAVVLIKARGKCTTDHISMAGPWLKFRGHLNNISNNMYIGAVNDANGKENSVLNVLTGKEGEVPATAREYKKNGIDWVVIGDSNLGEGSSREHAAVC